MILEEIQNLKIENHFVEMLMRLNVLEDFEQIPNEEGIILDWYDSFNCTNKPSKEAIISEFESYKAKLIQIEKDRLEEEARIYGLTERFMALYNKDMGFPSFREVWPEISNPLAFFNENKANKTFDFKFDEIEAKELLRDKAKLVEAAYNKMNADVYQKMFETFGTKNAESAQANQATWALMIQSPEKFAGKIDGLSTSADVLAFATPKHEAAIAYGIWRENRINSFRAEREGILL